MTPAPAAAPSRRLDRLRHAVGQQSAAQRPASAPTSHDALAKILRVLPHDTPSGTAFVRDDWYPLDHAHGALPLSSPLHASPDALSHLLGATDAPEASRLAFFDIETTGLAGGTGTYVVLAGLGSFERDGFRLRQYFLADIAHERAMLEMLAGDLARFEGVVTYNGRAFDIPFVETRLTLARLRSPCGGLAHFDLLHAVRRLYKHRMPGCRLAEAERRLLRIERFDDISGSLIPALYFDYVRAGRATPLRGVFRHNAEDVLSMVGLLASLAGLLSGGPLDPDDAVAVARWWERAGEPTRALALYRPALPWLEGGDDWTWAASRHARLCKRAGLRLEAVALWSKLWEAGDRAAGLELAMHFEHHARDYGAAAALARALLDCCAPHEKDVLELRLARITRKARGGGPVRAA